DIFYFFNIIQHVDFPTQKKGHTLDLVCTAGITISNLTSIDLTISDHLAITLDIDIPTPYVRQNRTIISPLTSPRSPPPWPPPSLPLPLFRLSPLLPWSSTVTRSGVRIKASPALSGSRAAQSTPRARSAARSSSDSSSASS